MLVFGFFSFPEFLDSVMGFGAVFLVHQLDRCGGSDSDLLTTPSGEDAGFFEFVVKFAIVNKEFVWQGRT
jgi:hypothetical protein